MKLLNHQAQHFSSHWKTMRSNWIIGLVNKFVLGFTVLSILAILWRWHLLPPAIPLWYSRPWGIDQLAPPIWLLVLPISSIIVYLLNLVIAIYVTHEYLIFTQILFLSSFVISLLSFITLIKILFLVT
ncbi:hypothetical protein A2Z00_01125 [Candidatus Gottesmanbacteria bacterium RBG_13_45_10]|uniref:DUF1648 domain-containing protein n=1 Tax=Candidatus Gottesmanbacteria bacterium RBG_13_45_10 TaxID=1798370 RepID=A0A1F5ZHQ0_9BACT|nr:MAG: hypothetical protein A2Z00_01125 [Candidatus Gottesmanbacteria bacterium RBG_13_45_10]